MLNTDYTYDTHGNITGYSSKLNTPTATPSPVSQTAVPQSNIKSPTSPVVDVTSVSANPQKPKIPQGNDASAIITAAAPLMSSSKNLLQQLTNEDKKALEEAKAQYDPLNQAVSQASQELASSSDRYRQAEQGSGLPQMRGQLQNIQNQIANLNASYMSGLVDTEGKPIPMQFITGQQAQLQKQYAVQVGALTAQAQALSGNITAAQDAINKAVELQTADLKQNYENTKRVLDDNKDLMTKAQQRVADDRKAEINQQIKEIDQFNKDKSTTATNAASYGAPADVIEKITKADNIGDMLREAKGYLTDPVEKAYKLAQIENMRAKTGTSINGTAGEYEPIDTSNVTNPNKGNPEWGGLSFNALKNNAAIYLSLNGKMPSLGLGQNQDVKKARAAIQNYAGQIADSLGMSTPQISAMYKANSKAASDIISRVAKIEATSNSLVKQFPRLEELADKVGTLGISEQDLTKSKAEIMRKFNSQDAASYIELINTVRSDYSAMQAAIGGGRGGEYVSRAANEAIPVGASSDVYRSLADTINQSSASSLLGTQEAADKLMNQTGLMLQAPEKYAGVDMPTQQATGVGAYNGITLPN